MADSDLWEVIFSDEVREWYVQLGDKDKAFADRAIGELARRGHMLGMPLSKLLGDGLRELRFSCEDVHRRITYYLEPERKAITLTTFRKQRQNERREIDRARKAMRRDQEGRQS